MLPWICAENHDDSMFVLSDTDADIVMGHLEISGFTMHRGMQSHEGLDREYLKSLVLCFQVIIITVQTKIISVILVILTNSPGKTTMIRGGFICLTLILLIWNLLRTQT